jgi:hypothetical protein
VQSINMHVAFGTRRSTAINPRARAHESGTVREGWNGYKCFNSPLRISYGRSSFTILRTNYYEEQVGGPPLSLAYFQDPVCPEWGMGCCCLKPPPPPSLWEGLGAQSGLISRPVLHTSKLRDPAVKYFRFPSNSHPRLR